jgi:hypothetical protein
VLRCGEPKTGHLFFCGDADYQDIIAKVGMIAYLGNFPIRKSTPWFMHALPTAKKTERCNQQHPEKPRRLIRNAKNKKI